MLAPISPGAASASKRSDGRLGAGQAVETRLLEGRALTGDPAFDIAEELFERRQIHEQSRVAVAGDEAVDEAVAERLQIGAVEGELAEARNADRLRRGGRGAGAREDTPNGDMRGPAPFEGVKGKLNQRHLR